MNIYPASVSCGACGTIMAREKDRHAMFFCPNPKCYYYRDIYSVAPLTSTDQDRRIDEAEARRAAFKGTGEFF